MLNFSFKMMRPRRLELNRRIAVKFSGISDEIWKQTVN